MTGIFLGQGFEVESGTKITYEIIDSERVAIWDEKHEKLLYILPQQYIEEE